MNVFEKRRQSMFKGCIETYRTLPNEYQEVEYIESTGTQYINTDYVGTSLSKMEIVLKFLETTSDQTNGLAVASGRIGIGFSITGGYNHWYFGTGDVNNNTNYAADLVKHKFFIDIKNKKYGFDNVTNSINFSYSNPSSAPVELFCRRYENIRNNFCTQRLYSCKLYTDDVIKRDFVPCYRKSDNVVGLYDLIENKFYINQGTGTFLKGNDVVRESNEIEIHSPSNEPIKDYKIYGNSYQPLEPSIEKPCDIISLGESGTIDMIITPNNATPNLLDINNFINEINSSASTSWGVLQYQYKKCIKFLNNDYIHRHHFNNPTNIFKSNTRYTLKLDAAGSDKSELFIGFSYTDGSASFSTPLLGSSFETITYTSLANKTVSSFRISYGSSSVCYIDLDSISLQEGISINDNVDNGYSKTKKYVISLGEHEPLRKIGDSSDCIDFKRKKIIRNIHKHEITDSGWIGLNNTYSDLQFCTFTVPVNFIQSHFGEGYSNVAICPNAVRPLFNAQKEPFGLGWSWETNRVYFFTHKTFNSVGDLYNYISQNGTIVPYVMYKRQTPIEDDFPECPDIELPDFDCIISVSSGDEDNALSYILSNTGDTFVSTEGDILTSNSINEDYKTNANNLEIEAYVK